eukprot:5461756-Prorocentrum_lima.AAC.1
MGLCRVRCQSHIEQLRGATSWVVPALQRILKITYSVDFGGGAFGMRHPVYAGMACGSNKSADTQHALT